MTRNYDYNKSKYCKWIQENNSPATLAFYDCTDCIFAFQINAAPKFDESKSKKAYHDALLRQKAFIDTVNTVFFKRKGIESVLELRLRNDPRNKQIYIYILLRIVRTSESGFIAPKTLKDEFKRLIPEDYGNYRELDLAELDNLLSLSDSEHVVDIRKKPTYLPVGATSYEQSAGIAPKNLDIKALEKARYYIPLSSYLEPKYYNLSNLYQTLQNSNDVVQLRISISSIDVYEYEKNLAFQYNLLVKEMYKSVDIPEISFNLQTFTKYISANQLFSLKIQVAAQSEITAISFANTFCGELAYGEIKSQTNLSCLNLRNYKDFLVSDWQQCNHCYYPIDPDIDLLSGIDPYIETFISRMSYVSDSAEIMAVFRLPISNESGLPGIRTIAPKPFYQPDGTTENPLEDNYITLGKIITAANAGQSDDLEKSIDYTLSVKDLTKHGLIVGATGSGKTNTTLNFIKQLAERNIPFLLIEPVKSEYYDALKHLFKDGELNRFNFKNPYKENGDCDPEYFRFNPFIPVEGISAIQHISYIKSCFAAAFPMYGIAPMMLEECLHVLYEEVSTKDKMFDPGAAPKYIHDKKDEDLSESELLQKCQFNFNMLLEIIDTYLSDEELYSDEDRSNFGGMLKRRISKLKRGYLGHAFYNDNWKNLDLSNVPIANNMLKMLKGPTIIELEHLADNDEKALIMAFILTYIFEYRQTQPSLKSIENDMESIIKGSFKVSDHIHVTLIEEAHRLLSNSANSSGGGEEAATSESSKSKSISLFIDMLAEIRAKGESIFVIEQIPTKLISEVLKNTNLKIMHRITSRDDRHYLGEAMNMNEHQKNYVTNLKTGEAIIFDEQLDNPIFVKMSNFNDLEKE